MEEKREQWTSKLGFILASAGAAIGLGAIWKLPYVTGMSGGGRSVFPYFCRLHFIYRFSDVDY